MGYRESMGLQRVSDNSATEHTIQPQYQIGLVPLLSMAARICFVFVLVFSGSSLFFLVKTSLSYWCRIIGPTAVLCTSFRGEEFSLLPFHSSSGSLPVS